MTILNAFVNGMSCRSDYSMCSTKVSMETWERDVKFVRCVWHQGIRLVSSQPSRTTGILIFKHQESLNNAEIHKTEFPREFLSQAMTRRWHEHNKETVILMLLSLKREK